MRYFTKMGPYSLNGYAEIPEDFPVDYNNDLYDEIDVFCGLTYGGYGRVSKGQLFDLYSLPIKWCDDEEYQEKLKEFKKRMIKRKKEFPDAEFIPLIGFDTNHIPEMGYCSDVELEAKNLASQVDEIIKKRKVG